jgi:valyl-tRNA synthetase
MDKIDDIMGKWHRHRELEVFLTTYDGSQHLRLHGWLKRNDVLIKSENIVNQKDYFGVFTVYITENQLNKLKEQNTESSLFMDLEVMSTESERWNLFQDRTKDKDKIIESIENFMFSFQIRDKEDIEKFLKQANETSLALFKKNKDFIDDYVETEEMSAKDKVKDLDLMIEAFVEEERYEDCALLVKIKDKIKKHYRLKKLKQKIKGNE